MNRSMVQAISMAIILAIIVIQIIWMRKHPDQWRWSIPVFLWMLHAFIFYVTVFFTDLPHTDWSAVLRLHGYISIFIVEAARLRRGSY